MWFNLSELVKAALLLYQFLNDGIPFLFDVFRKFLVVPTCLLLQIGHHKQNTINETVAGAFSFCQLAQDFLLDSTNDRDIRTLDEDGTLGILAVGYGGLGTEYREPELFLRTVIVAVEVLEPSGQLVCP